MRFVIAPSMIMFALIAHLHNGICARKSPLELDCAYVVPDFIPAELTESRKAERHRGGYVHIFVRNVNAVPVRITNVSVDGVAVDELHSKRKVAWWRIQPNPIPPRRLSAITVRLQELGENTIKVRLIFDINAKPLQILLRVEEPVMRIVMCAFSPQMDMLYAMVKSASDRPIVGIEFDGIDVTAQATIREFFRGIAPIIVHFKQPLRRGSFHILKVIDDAGNQVACRMRAWDSMFEIGTFGNHFFADYAVNGFNTYQSFGPLSREKIELAHQHGLRITAPYFRARIAYFYEGVDLKPIREKLKKIAGHPALLAYYLEDEPDVFDWQYCGSFNHWFELSFDAPVEIAKVIVREFKAYMRECIVQCWVDGAWHDIARKTESELANCRRDEFGRQIEFTFKPLTTTRLRIFIPRSYHMPGIRELEVYNARGDNIARHAKPRASSRFLAWYGRAGDEPDKAIDKDVKTYWRASHSIPEWVGATAMEMVSRAMFYESIDPNTLTMCLVDNTYCPANWFTYAQLADIFDTDPYVRPSLSKESNLRTVYQKSLIACRASAPNPCFITLWMGWGSGHCRCLTEAEERIMVWYALGAGARGINYFIHSSSMGDYGVMTGVYAFPSGPQRRRAQEAAMALWKGVGRINQQLQLAGKFLSRGYPVDAVLNASPEIWVRTILCANDAMVLIIANEQYSATGEGFTYKPIQWAKVKIAIPPWLKPIQVAQVTPQGMLPIPFETRGDAVTITIPEVGDGVMVIVR